MKERLQSYLKYGAGIVRGIGVGALFFRCYWEKPGKSYTFLHLLMRSAETNKLLFSLLLAFVAVALIGIPVTIWVKGRGGRILDLVTGVVIPIVLWYLIFEYGRLMVNSGEHLRFSGTGLGLAGFMVAHFVAAALSVCRIFSGKIKDGEILNSCRSIIQEIKGEDFWETEGENVEVFDAKEKRQSEEMKGQKRQRMEGLASHNEMEKKDNEGCLYIVKGIYQGARIPLKDMEPLVVGRDPGQCSLVIQGIRASRKHLSICYSARMGRYVVTDYSSNGSFQQNGERISPNTSVELPRGTELYLGDQENILRLE